MKQRGFGLVELAIYGVIFAVVAGGIWKAWDSFKDSIARPYVQEQVLKDQKTIDGFKQNAAKADEERDHAIADRDTAQKAASEQTDALKAAQVEQEKAQAAARALGIKYAAAVSANAKRIAELQTRATGQPVARDCAAMLGATDAILRDSAKRRLGVEDVR